MATDQMNLEALKPEVRDRVRSFLGAILEKLGKHVESFTVTGRSALDTDDYQPETIQSVLVVDRMSLHYIEDIAPLGKKHGTRGVHSPLVMSREYIEESLDVFPMEFLNFQWAHKTVYGKDPFQGLSFQKKDLRLQCERELKLFLIRLRQGYLSSTGQSKLLENVVRDAATNFFSIVRGVLFLVDGEIRHLEKDDMKTLRERFSLSAEGITSAHLLETLKKQPQKNFETFYAFADELSRKVNDLEVK